MRFPVLVMRLAGGIIMCVALGLAACGTVTDALQPNTLHILMEVKDYHVGNTTVSIHFADAQLNTVEFVHGETVTCNGVFLKYDISFTDRFINGGSYVGTVPLQPKDGAYTFAFTPAGGTETKIMAKVVEAPVTLKQPASGGIVAIPPVTGGLDITYGPSGLPNSNVIATVTDSRSHLAVSGALSDTGSVHFNGDAFKDFAAGTGNVSVTRTTDSKPDGTGFAAAEIWYENIGVAPITWQ